MPPFIQQTTPLSQSLSHPIDPIYPTYLPIPVNLHTLTRITAYFQKHLVKRLDGIKLIPPAHARSMLKLCYPIHFQTEQINTWHQDLILFPDFAGKKMLDIRCWILVRRGHRQNVVDIFA